MKTLFAIIAISVSLLSCNSSESYDYSEAATEHIPITRQNEVFPSAQNYYSDKVSKNKTSDTAKVNKKKIIKDGRIKIEVSDIENAKLFIDSIVNINDGYYAKENFDKTLRYLTYELTIRVPSNHFEKLVTSIGTQPGNVTYKNIDARDVTAQFVDLKTRLKNKKSYIKKYVQLLDKASEIKEILEIQEKIRRLEEEVESTEGQLKYLSDQINYSKLNLTVTQSLDYVYRPKHELNFWDELKDALSGGWYGFIQFILFLFRIWPLILISSVAVFFIKKMIKRRRLRKQK